MPTGWTDNLRPVLTVTRGSPGPTTTRTCDGRPRWPYVRRCPTDGRGASREPLRQILFPCPPDLEEAGLPFAEAYVAAAATLYVNRDPKGSTPRHQKVSSTRSRASTTLASRPGRRIWASSSGQTSTSAESGDGQALYVEGTESPAGCEGLMSTDSRSGKFLRRFLYLGYEPIGDPERTCGQIVNAVGSYSLSWCSDGPQTVDDEWARRT